MTPVIAARNLHYKYEDGTVALAGVDFDLFPGETVAVFGGNGSGKTTFVLHLNGLLEGQGAIEVCGLPVKSETLKQVRQKIGIVFQDPDDQLFMPSVLDDVAFGPLNLGMPPDQAAERARIALDQVGMLDHQHKAPYHLSAGEKKRVAIAGVLAMDPEVLVLGRADNVSRSPRPARPDRLVKGSASKQVDRDTRRRIRAIACQARGLLRKRPHRRRRPD